MMNKNMRFVIFFLLSMALAFSSEYDNLNKLYNVITPQGMASISCIQKYGEPIRKETKRAKDFLPWTDENNIFIFYYYENAEFVFFVGNEEKDFTYSWTITGDFSSFISLLSENMSINDVKRIFGDKHDMQDMYSIKGNTIMYGLDEGDIGFEIVDNKLVYVYMNAAT